MPALPLDEAGQYVAGAYVVFLALVLVYVAIIGAKITRIEHELSELLELTDDEAGRSTTAHHGTDAPRNLDGPSAHQADTARRSHRDAGQEAPQR